MSEQVVSNDVAELSVQLRQVIPFIRETVDVCCAAHDMDDCNDNVTFGVHIWRNLTNRLQRLCDEDQLPIRYYSDGDDRYFIFGKYRLRFHRVDASSLVPRGAKAAKAAAPEVGGLFATLELFETAEARSGRDILVGIVADQFRGLQKVTVGELVREAGTEIYRYDQPPCIIYDAGSERSGVDQRSVPEEDVPPPAVLLREPAAEKAADNSVRTVTNEFGIQKASNA